MLVKSSFLQNAYNYSLNVSLKNQSSVENFDANSIHPF